MLFLGSATPAIYLDDDDHDVPINTFYGLLFACGMPSDNAVGSLKRSCRQAINLVKWLLLDYKDSTAAGGSATPTMPNKFKLNTGLAPGAMGGGGGNNNHNNASLENVELNVFSKAFLSLPVDYYRHMRLDLHVTGDERGGSREDACKIIVFILMKHLSEDSEYTQYVIVEELLSTPQAQQAYDLWSARNVSVSVQEKIKKNSLIRQAEIANRQRQDAINARQGGPTNNMGGGGQLPGGGGGGGGPGGDQDYDPMMNEESENQHDDEDNNNNKKDDNDPHQLNKNSVDDDKDDDSYYDPDENDVMAAIRRRQKKARKEAELAAGGRKVASKGGNADKSKTAAAASAMFVATRWEDSQVSREQAARAASAARAGQHDTVRDSQDAAAEAAERLEEKFRLLGRDPLGILKFQDQYAQATGTTNTNNNNNNKSGGNNESNSGKNNDNNTNDMIIDGGDYYDLRVIELKQAQYMEMALQELNEEIQKAESTGNDELIKKAIFQKESLEALVERLGGIEAMESINALLNANNNNKNLNDTTTGGKNGGKNTTSASYLLLSQQQQQQQYQKNNIRASILPTNPKFDPILFLTLLHRKSSYSTLNQSLDRLSSKLSHTFYKFCVCFCLFVVVVGFVGKLHTFLIMVVFACFFHSLSFFAITITLGKTENQAEQLQNLVRDNFPLFVRCAEGFEEFRRSSEQEVGLGVNERIETLEAIAESCAYQAKKSFKPLLDNTSEVRKVQSSLAVLNRVGPILQVPALMRQHIENRRYSQALKTYRRALVIDDSCNIELLKLVKKQAEECVRDARLDLERRITQDQNSSTVDDLLNGIRDLGELLELDVTIPEVSTKAIVKLILIVIRMRKTKRIQVSRISKIKLHLFKNKNKRGFTTSVPSSYKFVIIHQL